MTGTSDTPDIHQRRNALDVLARAWGLEGSVTSPEPSLCWTQVRNRLSGSAPTALQTILDAEESVRSERPWLRLRTSMEGGRALVWQLPYLRGSDPPGTCRFTRDQRWLLADGLGCLLIYDAREGRLESRLALNGSPRAVAVAGRYATCAVLGGGYVAPSLTTFDLADGRQVARAMDDAGKIEDCAASPDGAWVASASRDGGVIIRRVPDLVRAATLEQRGSTTVCRFSPDGTYLVSAGSGGPATAWSTDGWAERLRLDHGESVKDVAISPDGTVIVTAGAESVRMWSADSGALRSTLPLEQRSFKIVCRVSPDARFTVATCKNVIKVWRLEDGLEHVDLDHEAEVTDCAIAPNGSWMISAGWDGMLKVWDLETGVLRSSMPAHPGGVWACDVSPDGTRVASAGMFDETLKVWEIDETPPGRTPRARHRGTVEHLAFHRDGSFLVSAGADGSIKIWDPRTGDESGPTVVDLGRINACVVSPDGAVVAAGVEGGTVKLWSAPWMEERGTLGLPGAEILACAFDPAGIRLASVHQRTVTRNGDETTERWVAVWEVNRPSETPETTGPWPGGWLLSFASSGALLARRRGEESLSLALWDPWRDVMVWESEVLEWRGLPPSGVASTDGAWAATLAGGILVWDAGRGLETIGWHVAGRALCFSPDGSLIATIGGRSVRVWDWTTRFAGYRGSVLLAEAFLPDRLTCVGFVGSASTVACGDEAGAVHVLDLVGLDPPVPIARRRRGEEQRTLQVTCPHCRHASTMTPGWLWQLCECPTCGTEFRVAPSFRRF